MLIFIDIETIPGPVKPLPEEVEVPKTYTKPESIKKFQEENVDNFWKKQALNPLLGRIVSTGYAVENGGIKTVTGENESDVILTFNNILQEFSANELITWVGYNVKAFDLQWLWLRAKKYNCKRLAQLIPRDRYSPRIIDLIEKVSGSYRFDGYSLDNVLKYFGLTQKTGNGSEVFDLWQGGDWNAIAEYNKADVEVTRNLYRLIEE